VEQLDHAPQGRLGALQIVFRQLYEEMDERAAPRIVTHQDLERIGNVEGSIERFVSKELRDCGARQGLSPVLAEHEVVAWKLELCNLVRIQPDGTATTEVRSVSDLKDRFGGSLFDFDATTEQLQRAGILKTITHVDRQGRSIPYFAIGHDTVGLVLSNWKTAYDLGLGLPSPVSLSEDEPEIPPSKLGKDIALCLSGFGYRAMLFNLGAVWRLNDLNLLRHLGRVSGVSAGALVAAFLATRWDELVRGDWSPTVFRETLAIPLMDLAGRTIDTSPGMIGLLLGSDNAVNRLEKELQRLFGDLTLQDMPDDPRFVYSATNMQLGTLFLMSKSHVGDATIGRVAGYPMSIAKVVAASNSLPPIVTSISMDLARASSKFPERLYLATGSMIDHLGLEAAWDHQRTILISDGAVEQEDFAGPPVGIFQQTLRTINVLDKRLRIMRRRQIDDAFRSQIKSGSYWSVSSEEYPAGIQPARLKELLELPPRLSKLDMTTIQDLINLGYSACSAAIARDLPSDRQPREVRLPYP
jgi:NTE family protein